MPWLKQVLTTADFGSFASVQAPKKDRYRVVACNLERSIELEGQLEALKSHEYLQGTDLFLLTETNVGMARSGNRDVARELAKDFDLHYTFAPCYLNLAKGSGLEYEVDGENRPDLQGSAILRRYPLEAARSIQLQNGKDKMAGREKRIGNQAALVVEVRFPNRPLTAIAVHLDAQFRQAHRRDQVRVVIDALQEEGARSSVATGIQRRTTPRGLSTPSWATGFRYRSVHLSLLAPLSLVRA